MKKIYHYENEDGTFREIWSQSLNIDTFHYQTGSNGIRIKASMYW
jgi:hypothetical protein